MIDEQTAASSTATASETPGSTPDPDDRLSNDDSLRTLVDTFTDESGDDEPVEIGHFQPPEQDETPPETEDDPDPEADPPEEDPPKEEGDPKPDEPPPAEDADDSYPDDEEVKSYTPSSQKRIKQLIRARKRTESKLAEVEAEAEYTRNLNESLKNLGVDKPSWDNWTQLGFLVQQNGASAASILRKMADNLDGGTESQSRERGTPSANTGGLDSDLQELVDSLDMSEQAAQKIQAERRTRAPATPPPTTPSATNGTGAPLLNVDPTERGSALVKAVNDEFAAKYPNEWDKMIPEVQKEMAKYKGSPPHLWGQIARDAAEKVITRRKRRVTSQPDPTLRANGSRPKEMGAVLETREGFVDAMLSGKLFEK